MRILAVLLSVVGLAVATASAATLPGKNMDFHAWTADGKPEGWGGTDQTGFRISRDCENPPPGILCAVKIAGANEGSAFQPLAQTIPPGASLGHGAILTG